MTPEMTPNQALQLISEALEPKAQGQISRSGYIAIQHAIEILAKAITLETSEKNEPIH
jgi:hypothetical protein